MGCKSEHPLIGLTPLWDKTQQRYWMFPDYMEHIRHAGGMPIILPLLDTPEDINRIIRMVDGILFTGGPDIDPAIYGSIDETGTVDVCVRRDSFEIPLMRLARIHETPTLCICRGIQILNVAMGGTVYEDIPSQYPTELHHMQQMPFSDPSHIVIIEKKSGLYELLGSDQIWVNSCHHQAIRRLAEGLCATAKSSDGLIEAVEMPEERFCIGVQWHPERLGYDNPSTCAIFRAFVEACCR